VAHEGAERTGLPPSAATLLRLQRAAGNGAVNRMLVQRAPFSSAKIELEQLAKNVNKAPNDFSGRRYQNRTETIHAIDEATIAGSSGGIVGDTGNAGGVRVDMQGKFHEDGRTFLNIQAQANDPTPDLRYPHGTQPEQKGTSLGEVHVEEALAKSTQPDVLKRMGRLLKNGLFQSIGPRASHPRPAFKITHPKD
jgi:hypothetical protein